MTITAAQRQVLEQAAKALGDGRVVDAIAAAEPIVAVAHDPGADLLLAHAYAAAWRKEDALAAMRQATQRKPPYPPAFMQLGVSLMDLGQLDEARRVCEAGIALTQDPTVRLALGHICLRQGDADDAAMAFQAVLDATPDRPDALAGLAKAKALAGDNQAAAELSRRALSLRPGMAVLEGDLARSLLQLNRRDEAELLLKRALPQGAALSALADASHGRLFLKPSAAANFLKP